MTTLFNANPRTAYHAGCYTGTHELQTVLGHGDFGLGALDRNDGELVVLDGRAYRTAADGRTDELPGSATTPYATVIPFRPERTTELPTLTRTDFEARIAGWLPLSNRIWALRIHGRFAVVEAGAGTAQTPPYRPVREVLPEYHWISHRDTTGTLVAFAAPDFLLGHNYVGLHYHWLSDDRAQGGHVRDFSTTAVTVAAAEATTYTLDLALEDGRGALDLTPHN